MLNGVDSMSGCKEIKNNTGLKRAHTILAREKWIEVNDYSAVKHWPGSLPFRSEIATWPQGERPFILTTTAHWAVYVGNPRPRQASCDYDAGAVHHPTSHALKTVRRCAVTRPNGMMPGQRLQTGSYDRSSLLGTDTSCANRRRKQHQSRIMWPGEHSSRKKTVNITEN